MKTVCVYHSIDLDGWMSAAIVKHWFKADCNKRTSQTNFMNYENLVVASGDVLSFIGYNYGDPIPDLSEYDKVLMCDISFPKKDMQELLDRLKLNFIWLDHHVSAITDNDNVGTYDKRAGFEGRMDIPGMRDTKFAACELTWMYFFPTDPMPEIVRLLGRYDCFGHKGTDEEQKVLEFQYGARGTLKNMEDCYGVLSMTSDERFEFTDLLYHEGVGVYKYLCTEAKQAYRNGFTVAFKLILNDGIDKDCIYYNFICINKERFNPINFGIDYHKDGYDGCACFHRRSDGKWTFSLYNDNGRVDCSAIAKQFGGGGHKGAAGFVVTFLDLIVS